MIGDDIIRILDEGPMHVRQICARLNRDYFQVGLALTACVRRQLIVVVGTAGEFGCADVVRSDAPMYALPGESGAPRPVFGNNTGLTAKIRAELAKGPATIEHLVQCTGEKRDRVKSMVQQLVHQTGGVVALPGTPARYALYSQARQQTRARRPRQGSGNVAGPVTIGRGYRWWSGAT